MATTAPTKGWAPDQNGSKIFALLVGIDDYEVAPLGGCKKDVALIEHYLVQNHKESDNEATVHHLLTDGNIEILDHGNLYICKLTDGMAKYDHIIMGFRLFLRHAKSGDAVWFHYSGHGSQQLTAEAFSPYEANDRDQTLVCHDSYEKGKYMMADKELGRLLEEVAGQYIDGTAGKSEPHIIVTLDCCHSGSGTREQGLLSRQLNYDPRRRPIDSYLNGTAAFVEQGKVHLPASRHLLISGCKSIETAGDSPRGGIFTTSLIEVLEAAGGRISYADLYVQTRIMAKRRNRAQTPQFETIANFNPYVRFLDASESEEFRSGESYEVYYSRRQWNIRCGSLHGLTTQTAAPIRVTLQHTNGATIGEVEIDAVGALNSSLILRESIQLDPANTIGYRGVIRHMPAPPLMVCVEGETAGVASLSASLNDNASVGIVGGDINNEYRIRAVDGRFEIRRPADGKLVFQTQLVTGKPAYDTDQIGLVESALGHILKWERMVHLHNNHSTIEGLVELHLEIAYNQGESTFHSEDEVRLEVTLDDLVMDEDQGTDNLGFLPIARIHAAAARKMKKDLHIYLLHLSEDYAVTRWNYIIFRHSEQLGEALFKDIPLLDDYEGWGLDFQANVASSHFKILVTTREIMIENFQQTALGKARAQPGHFSRSKGIHDWATAGTKVTIQRKN